MSAFILNRDLWKNIEEPTEKLRFLLIVLLVFSLPFNIFYSSVLLITLLVLTLLDLSKEKLGQIPRQVWLFQMIYFLGIAGYFYSNHKNAAAFLLERQLSILLLPLMLPIAIRINWQKAEALIITLVVSCCVSVCYLLLHMLYTIITGLELPLVSTVFLGVFFNHQFSMPIGIHAGYLSLYISFSIFYLAREYNQKNRTFRQKMSMVMMLLLLFTGLFLLASRNSILATFFVLIFVSPLYNSKNKLKYILVCLICLITGFVIVKSTPYLRNRFSIQLLTDIKPLANGDFIEYGSAEPRYERWKGAFQLVKHSPVFGYGTGDEIEMLRTEYIKRGLYISYLERFNAHNQYLSYLIKNGIPGLCIFLFAFYYYTKLAVKKKNFIYLSFLVLLLIGFYTENILDANKGILFFSIFNTILGYAALTDPQTVD